MDLHWDEYDVESPSIYTHSCPVLPLSSLMYKHRGFCLILAIIRIQNSGFGKGETRGKSSHHFCSCHAVVQLNHG